jgi:zinc transporter, ZIP family
MDPRFGGSFAWGLVASSSLLLGALVAIRFDVSRRAVGLTLAFGSGVLISAVAFDLVEEGSEISNGSGGVGVGLFAGCLVFFAGDRLIDRFGSAGGQHPDEAGGAGDPLGIVLGAVLDGIPESMVIGLTLLQSGEVGAAYIAAVFLSNVPEGIGATKGLLGSGWSRGHVVLLWSTVAAACALSSLAGYSLLNGASVHTIAFVLAFAGGAILTMLASEMMPEAFEFGGALVGVVTTLGFGVAYALHSFA